MGKTEVARILFIFVMVGIFCSCQQKKNNRKKILVACASSAQFAIADLARQFELENEVTVEVISGSSGKLTTQILHGAPYDLFFSADMSYPGILFEKKKCATKPKLYGYGRPVIWSMFDEISMDTTIVNVLAKLEEGKIAIANPKNAPYGEVAVQFMKDKRIYEQLEPRLVYAENISQVNEYIMNKSVVAGITAKSVVLASKNNLQGKYYELGERYKIEQGVVTIPNSNKSEMKMKFYDFVFSQKGREILKKYGY